MIIFSQLADIAFRDSAEALPDQDIVRILEQEDDGLLWGETAPLDVPEIVQHAYNISDALFSESINIDLLRAIHGMPKRQEQNVRRHTFYETTSISLGDAERTAARFPLNVAFTEAKVAQEQGIPGFDATSLAGIAHIIRRSDTRNIVHTAALTRNGKLAHRADRIITDLTKSMHTPILVYNPESQEMEFSEDYRRDLLDELRRVNQHGLADGTSIPNRTSSGCPVLHDKPHLTGSKAEKQSLKELSDHFGVSIQTLTERRDRTGIDVGLDYLADTLDRADAIHQRLAATALAASV